jgi:hypothetical protein
MKAGSPSSSSNHSRIRLGLTVIIALIVISSTTTITLFSPAQLLAYSRVIENSNDHSKPPMSEERSPTVSSPSTPTIQAPLQIPRTLQSTDLVNSLAFYEVTFITSTAGAIDKIRMDFPAGTNIAAAGVIERVGIGGGTLLKSGSSITFDVTSPVSIPAGTFIRLEMFGIKNPNNPSDTFTATVTTRDSGGNLIDGPSQTNVYTMRQIGTNDIADSSITSTKPNEGFMKRVTLLDNAAGNALGWIPDGSVDNFVITEPAVSAKNTGFVDFALTNNQGGSNNCQVTDLFEGGFRLECGIPPQDMSSQLHYVVENLPAHIS